MAYNKIGRIRPAYVGEWVSSKAYDALDIVKTANGSMSYIAQKDVPAGTPLSNSSYWALVLDVQNTLNAVDAAIQRTNEQTDNAVARADAAVGRVDNAMDGKISSLTASVSGNPVRIRAEEHSTIKPLLTFNPIQSGSGEPSPSNIRPITGRTGAELVRCGKNLLPNNAVSVTKNGLTFTVNNDGTVTVDGTCDSTAFYSINNTLSLPQGEYIINGNPVGYDYSKVRLYVDKYDSVDAENHRFALAATQIINVSIVILAGVQFNNVVFKPMLRLASISDATYESYQGDTFTLNFGQTIYGGTLDWNKGEMVVEWGYKALSSADMSSSMKYVPGYVGAWSGDIFDSYALTGYGKKIICNVLPDVAVYGQPKQGIYINSATSIGIQLKGEVFDNYTDTGNDAQNIDLVKAYLDANDVYFAYELATPITIQLTPDYISALFGEWTYYSNADQMTVNYNLDLLEILEKNEDAHIEKANGLKSSITGNLVQIYPDEGSIIKPVLRFEPVQSGSGDPSPENIRPITGWTGAVLTRCGKNLINSAPDKTETSKGVSFSPSNDGFGTKMQGTSTDTYAQNAPGRYSTLMLPPGDYTFSVKVEGNYGNTNVGFIYQVNNSNVDTVDVLGPVKRLHLDSETKINWFAFVQQSGVTVDCTAYFQLELGSTATPFEPYQDDAYTLDFGKTVYNGMLDCSNGELTASVPVHELTGNEGWNKASSAPNTFYFDYYSPGGNAGNPSLLNDICSHYKTASNTAYGSENAYYPLSYTGAIYRHMFTDKRFNDVASWKAYLAEQKSQGTPVQVTECAIAHTTTSIKINPVKIIALDGVNTLYSNADDITVNYSKDLTKAFEEVLSLLATLTVNNT